MFSTSQPRFAPTILSLHLETHLITDIAICIMVAWILAVTAQLARQPLILAYLVAGVFLGPVGTGVVHDQASIETISGLGLLLLLFMIGLEINLKTMLSAGKFITITAAAQIIGCTLLGLAFFRLCGFPAKGSSLDALYLAISAALSSTVIIVKILYEKRELDTFAGRVTLGVLVLQDLFAILFLAVQPELDNASMVVFGASLGKVALLVAGAFFTSKFVLPPLFRAVARLPELVSVGALAWCFLVSGFASNLHLSREMGALIAGVAISTFPYALDVGAKVTSLRDFFVTLFFVSLGMKIPAPSLHMISWGVLIAGFVVASRFITVFPPLYWMNSGFRGSLLPTLSLSQVSEMSLVVVALGLKSKHLGSETAGFIAYSFAILAVASSYAITRSEKVVFWFCPLLNKLGLRDLHEDQEQSSAHSSEQKPRVFLLGFSWAASSLVEEISRRDPDILKELAILDFNPVVHQELKQRGFRAIYGDIGQRDTLIHAGVAETDIIICTLPNTVLKGTTNLRLLQQLREINPSAQIIVHAEMFCDVQQLYAAGASYVSLPRLIEAVDLCEAVQAARHGFLDEKMNGLKRDLQDRNEVIP